MTTTYKNDSTDTAPEHQKTEVVRTHRVGSFSCGLVLICFGILYMISIFWNAVPLKLVFDLWPVIFISLGAEILISLGKAPKHVVYDKAAIIIMVLLVFFAMLLAGFDYSMTHGLFN